MSEWQPIETAPKDGTFILVARAGEDIGPQPMEITQWYELTGTRYEHVEGELYRAVKYQYAEGWNNNGHRATHWMPLPEPPEGTA